MSIKLGTEKSPYIEVEKAAAEVFEIRLTPDEMTAASEKASILLDMMFASTKEPHNVIKALALNTHGLFTALTLHIGAAGVKDILAMISQNVDSVQASIDAEAAAEATKH